MPIRPAAIALLLAAAAGVARAQPAPAPPACASAEHRQFDFWVGAWNVYRSADGRLVARSLIERLYGGCAIRENWMPLQGSGGGSLNSWLPDAGIWRQTWVDGMNSWAVFEGGLVDDAMQLEGVWSGADGPGSVPLVRIRWTREQEGAVRQAGQISRDGGASWSPYFDLIYRPAAAPADAGSE